MVAGTWKGPQQIMKDGGARGAPLPQPRIAKPGEQKRNVRD
jgi:hypothetical protein